MESVALTGFGGFYAGKRVLITGHTGFKGSWLALWLRALGAKVAGLALAPETSPAHWTLLGLDGIADHRVDVRDPLAVHAVMQGHRPDIVFHLAAQPLVRRSYREPEATFSTNVTGLIHLFEAVRACDAVRVLVNATLPFASSITVVFATAIAGSTASVPNTATASFDRSAVATQVAATAAVAVAPAQIPAVSNGGLLVLLATLLVVGAAVRCRQC